MKIRLKVITTVSGSKGREEGREEGKREQVLEKYLMWEAGELDGIPVKYEFELSGESKNN